MKNKYNELYTRLGVRIIGGIPKRAIAKCSQCGKEKELFKNTFDSCYRDAIKRGEEFVYKCKSCWNHRKGKDNPNFEGGRHIDKRYGYWMITRSAYDDVDKYVPLSCKHGVFEHRYIMAKHLGRPLLESEIVHHINGDKRDNRIENLQLIDANQHTAITRMESKWEAKIKDLQEENTMLRKQLFELVPD